MKVFNCLILLVLFTLKASAEAPISMTVNPEQDSFEITLPSNPSTGYKWEAIKFNKGLFDLIGSSYAPATESNVIGASGNTTFTFKVVKNAIFPRSSEIWLNYSQPWNAKSSTIQKVYITFKNWD